MKMSLEISNNQIMVWYSSKECIALIAFHARVLK